MSGIGVTRLDYLGMSLHTLTLSDGRSCWPVHQVGMALGYGPRGRGLLPRIRGAWAADFVVGEDYLVLRGADLESVRAAGDRKRPAVPASATRLPVLLRQGLDKVAERSPSARAETLRSFLDRHLGPVEPPPADPRPSTSQVLRETADRVAALGRRVQALRVAREERLDRMAWTRDGQLGLADRRFRVLAVQRVIEALESLGCLDPEVRVALEVEACAIATNDRVLLLGARDQRLSEDPGERGASTTRERRQLAAMTGFGRCPLVLAWEPDGRLGAFRFFPKLQEAGADRAHEHPEAA